MEKDNGNKEDVGPITEDDLLVYGAYGRVAYSLRHSNNVQLMYKLITFTLFIATLIGVGYLVSSREVDLPIPPLLIVPAVCLFSLLIIFIVSLTKALLPALQYCLTLHNLAPQLSLGPYFSQPMILRRF